MPLYQKILEASAKIKPYVYQTPLEKSYILSDQTQVQVYLKCEHLQKTGSFKFRGALNKILCLTKDQKNKGVIAASTGNHGIAVALAAKIAKINPTIYLSQQIPLLKLNLIKALGASTILCEGDCLQAEIQARAVSKTKEKVFISPYNDIEVIAGQGVIGVEIYDQWQQQNVQPPETQSCEVTPLEVKPLEVTPLDAVFIAVGGGGLISGIGAYLKQVYPNIRIIGCWPENAPAMYTCINEGKIIEVPEKPTLSEATAGGLEPGAITLEFCNKFIDDFVLVSEDEIITSMRLIAEHERFIIEGAAAVAVAGFLKTSYRYRGMNVAIVLCGRNIDLEKYQQYIK